MSTRVCTASASGSRAPVSKDHRRDEWYMVRVDVDERESVEEAQVHRGRLRHAVDPAGRQLEQRAIPPVAQPPIRGREGGVGGRQTRERGPREERGRVERDERYEGDGQHHDGTPPARAE